jgi:hypothetical protein
MTSFQSLHFHSHHHSDYPHPPGLTTLVSVAPTRRTQRTMGTRAVAWRTWPTSLRVPRPNAPSNRCACSSRPAAVKVVSTTPRLLMLHSRNDCATWRRPESRYKIQFHSLSLSLSLSLFYHG